MHLYKTMKNFLFDHDYFIDIWGQCIHVYNFLNLITVNDKLLQLQMQDFELKVTGTSFRVLKLTKNEILITGNIKEMRFFNE